MTDFRFEIMGLETAQAIIRQAYLAASPSGRLPELVHAVTLRASAEAGKLSPRLTGTLAASHRERMRDVKCGEVYIDPAVRNVILGGAPAVYGPAVHRMGPPRNWMERTVNEKGKKIVLQASQFWLKRNMP